jgi:hypothetical protein
MIKPGPDRKGRGREDEAGLTSQPAGMRKERPFADGLANGSIGRDRRGDRRDLR